MQQEEGVPEAQFRLRSAKLKALDRKLPLVSQCGIALTLLLQVCIHLVYPKDVSWSVRYFSFLLPNAILRLQREGRGVPPTKVWDSVHQYFSVPYSRFREADRAARSEYLRDARARHSTREFFSWHVAILVVFLAVHAAPYVEFYFEEPPMRTVEQFLVGASLLLHLGCQIVAREISGEKEEVKAQFEYLENLAIAK